MLLTHVRDLPGSSLGRNANYPDHGFVFLLSQRVLGYYFETEPLVQWVPGLSPGDDNLSPSTGGLRMGRS